MAATTSFHTETHHRCPLLEQKTERPSAREPMEQRLPTPVPDLYSVIHSFLLLCENLLQNNMEPSALSLQFLNLS